MILKSIFGKWTNIFVQNRFLYLRIEKKYEKKKKRIIIMKKTESYEWKIVSTGKYSSKENLLSYKDWETKKNENKIFIKKVYSKEELTNEWKIIMNSHYACKNTVIKDDPLEGNIEF